jgi:uncharacterized membrane protein YedE/YeeE
MTNETERVWNPYVAGGLSGVLLVLSVWIVGKFFGASTTFARAASMVEHGVDAERASQMSYFMKYKPEFDWQWMFVIGIFIGSLISAVASKSFRWMAVPAMWEERFGPTPGRRAVVALVGGFIAVFGARLAGGCPSGHGLSGLAQMSVSGYLALACFFAGGLPVAWLLYRRRADS